MKIETMKQGSAEWHELKRGKIGGTRFGQVISGRENVLLFELLNEQLSEWIEPDDFINDDMQFGLDNEPIARDLYNKQSGLNFMEVGAIVSDHSDIHLASPDGLDYDKVLEIKCTRNGAIHLQRFFKGVDTKYLPQIKNYFAVSDEVTEVHWVSYCPDRYERPLVVYIFTLDTVVEKNKTIRDLLPTWRAEIKRIEAELIEMSKQFTF
jgi:hypothetical protein